MWRWASDLSRVRRARKAACAAISPMIEKSRHRLGGIPDAAWSNPYIVGFTVMLISIVARVEVGKIEEQALCLVQAKAWEDITAMRSDLIGEDILLLSTARNRDFEIGCRNALTFGSMLVANSILFAGRGVDWKDRHLDLNDAGSKGAWVERDDVSAAWERFFDAYVFANGRDNMSELRETVS
jgi:hypothetical protein